MEATIHDGGKLVPHMSIPTAVYDELCSKPDVLRIYMHLFRGRNWGKAPYPVIVHDVPVMLGQGEAVASIDMVGEALGFKRDKVSRAIKKLEALGFLEYRLVETRKPYSVGVVRFVGLYREEQSPSRLTAVKDSEKVRRVTPYGEKDERGYHATGEGESATGECDGSRLTETKASEGTMRRVNATLSRSGSLTIQKPLPDMAIDPQAEGSGEPDSRVVLSEVGLRPLVSCPTCPESGGCQEPDPSSCSRKSKVAPSVVNPEVKPPPPNPPMEPVPVPSVSPVNGGLTFDDFLGALRHGDGDPDTLEHWRERASIREFDGLLPREVAEVEALKDVLKHKTMEV
jgi:hypothetical protein